MVLVVNQKNVIVSLVDTTRRSKHILQVMLVLVLLSLFEIAVACDGQTISFHQNALSSTRWTRDRNQQLGRVKSEIKINDETPQHRRL